MQQVLNPAVPSVQPQVSSSLLVRFNPLSAAKLGVPARLEGAWQDIQRLETLLDVQREQCCELLYQRIPTEAEPQKSFLMALRRDLFNRRPLKKIEQGQREGLEPEILNHLNTLEQVRVLKASLEQEFIQRLQQERLALQGTCTDEGFLKALSVSSTSMWEAAQAYSRTPLEEHRSRIRKTEHSLFQFATRAALKTSPFSHYTALAAAEWTDGPVRVQVPEVHAVSNTNHVVVRRLLDSILRHPEVQPRVKFQVNPKARWMEGQVVFEQRLDEIQRQPRAHKLAGRTIRLKKTAVLERLFQEPAGKTTAQWMDHLQPAPQQIDPCKAYLERLQEVGFLQPVVPIPAQSTDILQDLLLYLQDLGQTEAAVLVGRIRNLTAAFAQTPSQERARAQGQLKTLWTELHQMYGMMLPSGPLFYEDTSSTTLLQLDRRAWTQASEDLTTLIAALRVFDTHLLFRPLVRQVFEKHCPSGRMDVEEFVLEHPELFNDWLKLAVEGVTPELRADPVVAQALSLQKKWQQRYLEAAQAGIPLCFTREELQQWTSSMPESWQKQDFSYGVFVQPAATQDGVQLYINQLYQGHGQYFSRFLPEVHPDLYQRVQQNLQEHFKDRMLLGLNSVYGFNANLHPPLAPFELDIDDSGDPLKVRFSDLELRKVENDLKLFHKPTGQEVQVLYSGFLISQLLPPLESFLVTFCNTGLLTPYLTESALPVLRRERPDQILHLPEVSVGKVVLARSRHVVPRSQIPVQEGQETDEAYFVRLNLWRQKHQIPARVFARPQDAPAASTTDLKSWQDRMMRGSAKPQYLDFDSALGVRYFAKWLRDSTHGFSFEPCLPEMPDTLMHSSFHSPHTMEVLLEVTPTRGDHP